jgi:uncharacterized protein
MSEATNGPGGRAASAGGEPTGRSGCTDRSRIVNCHVHTFTIDHVPEDFVWFGGMRALRVPIVRRLLAGLGGVIPSRLLGERLLRFMQFAEVANYTSQGEIFAYLRGFYPPSARFVVLPVDMTYMGAGIPRRGIDAQHEELLALASAAAPHVIPFCAVDPRRPDLLASVRALVQAGCCGIKLYPALGFLPTDDRLREVYAFAQDADVPVITHCSSGGIRRRGLSRASAAALCHPEHYRAIATEFPRLRICLAHYGGHLEWHAYRTKRPGDPRTWVSQISDLMCEFDNVFADISYTMFRFQENVPILKILLADERLRRSVLFGSDAYMVELEAHTEREVSIELRAALGEELFSQIAEVNPARYLGERALGRWG